MGFGGGLYYTLLLGEFWGVFVDKIEIVLVDLYFQQSEKNYLTK